MHTVEADTMAVTVLDDSEENITSSIGKWSYIDFIGVHTQSLYPIISNGYYWSRRVRDDHMRRLPSGITHTTCKTRNFDFVYVFTVTLPLSIWHAKNWGRYDDSYRVGRYWRVYNEFNRQLKLHWLHQCAYSISLSYHLTWILLKQKSIVVV